MNTGHYEALIEKQDEILSLLREKWMHNKNASILKKMDSALEERFRLMQLRDGKIVDEKAN